MGEKSQPEVPALRLCVPPTAASCAPHSPGSTSASPQGHGESGSSGFAHSGPWPLLGRDFLLLLKHAIIFPHRLITK